MTTTLTAPPSCDPWAYREWRHVVGEAARYRALRELARRKLRTRSLLEFTRHFTPSYHVGWFHKELCDTLDAFIDAVEQGRRPRLIVEVPPRHGKSQIISRCFPAFALGKNPNWEIVTATYSQPLADSFGKYVRNILNSPDYQDLFPDSPVNPASNAANNVQVGDFGSYYAVGVEGSLTGRGAHILIIDDPVKDRADADSETVRNSTWDWYSSVARTRVAPGGGVIVLQTRWHEDDLAGRLQRLAKESSEADQWMVLSYPAIALHDEKNRKTGEPLDPGRWPLVELELIRGSASPRDWNALYQQRPVPDDGIFFSKTMLDQSRYLLPELPPLKDMTFYVSCDLAISEKQDADYTVIGTVGVDRDGRMWLMDDLVRARLTSFDIVEAMLQKVKKYKAVALIVERGHISKSIGPLLKKRMFELKLFPTIYDPVPHRDKMARAAALQGRMQQGMVKMPDTPRFQNDIFPEFMAFPAGMNDDVVDMLAHAAAHVDRLMPGRGPTSGESQTPAQDWYDQRGRAHGIYYTEEGRMRRNSNKFVREIRRLNGDRR